VIAVPIRRCVAPAAIASAKSPDIPAEIHEASGTTRAPRRPHRAAARSRGGRPRRAPTAITPRSRSEGTRGDVLGEAPASSGPLPARRIVGEIDLDEDVERGAVGVGGVQCVGDAVAVDGVHDVGCRAHRRAFFVCSCPMKCQRSPLERVGSCVRLAVSSCCRFSPTSRTPSACRRSTRMPGGTSSRRCA
jgi:hypothetical protein